ncbi:hypothetical protein AB6A40_007404 [Gnathostoma spinigerum]|uniref:Transmembrane protein n=1 Tax=Gnathostoma spinigerum TaxID=75299 RepID=A0ABD6EMC2_9BILA
MKMVKSAMSKMHKEEVDQKSGNLTAANVVRFVVSLLVVITMGLLELMSTCFLLSESTFLYYIGTILIIFIISFSYEWTHVHSGALTRLKKAYFDEANVLETYQPRARTMGHLFCPEPPTPAPSVKIIEELERERHSDAEVSAFQAMRDQHYANMFQHAMQMAKEREAMEKGGKESVTGDFGKEEEKKEGKEGTTGEVKMEEEKKEGKDGEGKPPSGEGKTGKADELI